MNLLTDLKNRNRVLYYFGALYLIGGLISIFMWQTSNTTVLGVNAWIKPMKFFLSIWIFSWTMGWYLIYLDKKRSVKTYTWVIVIVMLIEQIIITWQAANGRLSHFNTTNPFYMALFNIMGIAIVTLTVWTAVIAYYFFKQKTFDAPMPYIWGIRLGIVLFVIFSLEGGMMAGRLSHTVGGADGGEGLPIVNWSRKHGDLRVAHFVGIHSLQALPLFGYFIARSNTSVKVFAAGYFLLAMFLFIEAVMEIPVL